MKQLFLVAIAMVAVILVVLTCKKEDYNDTYLEAARKIKIVIDAGGSYNDYIRQLVSLDIVSGNVYSIETYEKMRNMSVNGKLQLLDVLQLIQ